MKNEKQNWMQKDNLCYKVLMSKDSYNVEVLEVELLKGTHDLLKGKKCICGYYILEGKIPMRNQEYGPGTLLWFKQGNECEVTLDVNAHALYVESQMELKKDDLQFDIFDENAMQWNRPNEEVGGSKHMIKPEEYGVKVQVAVYKEKYENPMHTHSVNHMIYVLDGMLEYQDESGLRLYGPGEYVVSDANDLVHHQQKAGTSYTKSFFVADGIFDFLVDGINTYNVK